MPLRTHIPRMPLSDFVDFFWFYEGPRPSHSKERVLPCDKTQIVINLHEDALRIYEPRRIDRFQSFRGSLLSGARSEFCVIDTANQVSIIGVNFKAGGAFPFFRLPADELHNVHVSLNELWGKHTPELRDQLLTTESPTSNSAFSNTRCGREWTVRRRDIPP